MRRYGLVVPSLLLLGACRPPVPVIPTREQSLEAAAQAAADAIPAARRPDFLEGFRMGARMVWEAASQRRLPWLPRMGEAGPAPLPEAARAMGAVAQDPGPRVELDPATGFPIRFLDPAGGGFGPGEVAGFAWALAPARDRLCRPRALPAFPDDGAWRAWQASGVRLSAPGLQVSVGLTGSTLFRSWEGNGFPPQRRWRPVPSWLAPRALALRDQALWIATEAHGTVALDLETGLVIALQAEGLPAGTTVDTGDRVWEVYREQRDAANRLERPHRLHLAAQGNTRALLDLAWASDDLKERAAWFRKAAVAGDPDGMYELGVLLYQGRGLPEDRAEAQQWFQCAAKAGSARARKVLKGLFQEP